MMNSTESYDYEKIDWNPKSMVSMQDCQKILMDYLLNQNFEVSQVIKDKIKKLHNDMVEWKTSVCSVCGNRQSIFTNMNVEHVTMKMDWGFGTKFDTEKHKLTLCEKCYDTHIMKKFS